MTIVTHSFRPGEKIIERRLADGREKRLRKRVNDYYGSVGPEFDVAETAGLEAAINFVQRNQYRSFGSADDFGARVWEEIEGAFSDRVQSAATRSAIAEAVRVVYRFYKEGDASAFGGRAPLAFGFGMPDRAAVSFAGRLDNFYLGKFISEDSSRAKGMEVLTRQWLENGEGIFGRGSPEAIEQFRQAVGGMLDDVTGFQARKVIDTSVVRIRSMSQMNQMREAEIDTARWVTNAGGCAAICARYDGKEYPLAPSYAELDRVTSMNPEQFENHIKDSGRIRESFADAVSHLRSGGATPPLHPYCECDIVAVV